MAGVGVAVAAFFVFASPARAATQTYQLRWLPPPQPVDYYQVYIGSQSHSYDRVVRIDAWSQDALGALSTTLTGLDAGHETFLAMQAYNAAGASPLSNEIVVPPAATSVPSSSSTSGTSSGSTSSSSSGSTSSSASGSTASAADPQLAAATFAASAPDTQLADVNGDGRLDLVTFNANNNGPSTLSVRLAGGASFALPQTWLHHGPSTPGMLQFADVNGDGRADALYFDVWRSHEVWVALATGTGFTTPRPWLIHGPSTPDMIQYADVNGDGKADALYFDVWRSHEVWVALSTGTGFTTPRPWLKHGPSTPDMIQYADVNGDGKADALYDDVWRSHEIWVALSTGTGFTPPRPWVAVGSPDPKAVRYADVNGDGKADLLQLVGGGTRIEVYPSTGSGFAAPRTWVTLPAAVSPSALSFLDITGNGKADLVARLPGGKVLLAESSGLTAAPQILADAQQ